MSQLGFIFDLGTELIHGYSEAASALSSHKSDFNKLFSGDAISVEQNSRWQSRPSSRHPTRG